MALAIVPCERKPHAPAKPQPVSLSFCGREPHGDDEHDDLHALVAALTTDEGLSPIEALSQALALHDELVAFAVRWDVDATIAGHPQGLPGVMPPAVPAVTPAD